MDSLFMFDGPLAIRNILKTVSDRISKKVDIYLISGVRESMRGTPVEWVLDWFPIVREEIIFRKRGAHRRRSVSISSEHKNCDWAKTGKGCTHDGFPLFLMENRALGIIMVEDIDDPVDLAENDQQLLHIASLFVNICLRNHLSWCKIGQDRGYDKTGSWLRGMESIIHEGGKENIFSAKTLQLADRLAEAFEEIRRKPSNDAWISSGANHRFLKRLATFIHHRLPIPFILPAFPAKSRNRETKAISEYPDMAEYLALKHLNSWCRRAQDIYAPGFRFVMFGDGCFYAPILDVPGEEVENYHRIVGTFPSKYIQWLELDDFLAEDFTVQKRNEYIDTLYFVPRDTFEQELKLHKNRMYNHFFKDLFPHHIRLSIHAHNNVDKIGVILFPGTDHNAASGTPWHNCAVLRRTGKWEFLRKKDAEELGCALRGQYGATEPPNLFYYVEPGADESNITEHFKPYD